MSSKRDRFLVAFAQVIRSADQLPVQCPLCGLGRIRFRYVAYEETRMGYCDAWCDVCLEGVHISRVGVPAGIEFREFSEAHDDEIPKFIHLE